MSARDELRRRAAELDERPRAVSVAIGRVQVLLADAEALRESAERKAAELDRHGFTMSVHGQRARVAFLAMHSIVGDAIEELQELLLELEAGMW